MKKTGWILIGLASAALILMNSTKALAKPTASGTLRDCDPKGCGGFGDSRTHGKHNGIDFLAQPKEVIFSPISGTVTKYSRPYANDANFTGVQIENEKYLIKVFYTLPSVAIGATVNRGQIIGTAQNIAGKYGGGMQNHIHLEVYDKKTGKLLNPLNLL